MKSLDHRNQPGQISRPVRQIPQQEIDLIEETIDSAIRGAVDEAPGCPLINIIGAVTLFFRNSPESELANIERISDRLDAMAISGELTRLHAISGNDLTREFTYYPKGWKFETTPRTQFVGAYKPPARLGVPLSHDHARVADAISTLIQACSDVVRLQIISKYCERCGAIREGHYCNE